MPAWTTEWAPEKPNVFYDGGLVYPQAPIWSIGAFGVFWPDRDGLVSCFNPQEGEYAYHSFESDGACLWGPMTGQRCSSTRAELLAGIIAILGPGPVHIASDSDDFIRKA